MGLLLGYIAGRLSPMIRMIKLNVKLVGRFLESKDPVQTALYSDITAFVRPVY